MDAADKAIIAWFNSDFGTNFSGGVVGNIALVVLSLLLALILPGIIGMEREYNGHPAGFRTHVLVSIGSCTVMLVSIYGFSYWDSQYLAAGIGRDPSRLAAQAVTGIGFLGAGTIIQNGISVKGLTTATTIWVCMAIGLACGAGSYIIAAVATILAFLVLTVMGKFEKLISKHNPILIIVVPAGQAATRNILSIAERFGIEAKETSSEIIHFQNEEAVRFSIRLSRTTEATLACFTDELRMRLHPLSLKISTNF